MPAQASSPLGLGDGVWHQTYRILKFVVGSWGMFLYAASLVKIIQGASSFKSRGGGGRIGTRTRYLRDWHVSWSHCSCFLDAVIFISFLALPVQCAFDDAQNPVACDIGRSSRQVTDFTLYSYVVRQFQFALLISLIIVFTSCLKWPYLRGLRFA